MHRLILGALLLLATLVGCTSPETRVLRGDEYSRLNQHALALREYQIARRKDPSLFDIEGKILTTQIALYLQQGDESVSGCRWRDADRAYNEVKRLAPDHPEIDARFERLAMARSDWHFERGQQLLVEGNPASAITEFEQTLIHRPDHPRAKSSLARAEQELAERVQRAEDTYRDGLLARQRGELEEAMRRFEEALALDPTHAGAAVELDSIGAEIVALWTEYGDSAALAYEWSVALEHYERAQGLAPGSTALAHRIRITQFEVQADEWVREGDDAMSRSDWAVAYDCFERARHRSAEPERFIDRYRSSRDRYAEDLFDQARAAEREGRYDDALASYRRVVTFHPEFRDVRTVCNTLSHRLDEAETEYALGCEAYESLNLILARDHYLSCLQVVPGYLDARERITRIERSLDLATSMYDRACSAQRQGDADRAKILFEECLAITRPFQDVQERLGSVRSVVLPGPDHSPEFEDGCVAQSERNLQRARKVFERCAKERPDHQDTAKRLDDVVSALVRAEDLYSVAYKAERAYDLHTARDGYRECLEICTPYRDAANRLVKLDEALRNLRLARRLEAQLELLAARDAYRKVNRRYRGHQYSKQRLHELDKVVKVLDSEYKKMVKAEKLGQRRAALTIAVGLRDRCLGFKDVEERIKRLELEVDYDDAVNFEQHEDWARASKCYERCVDRDPTYRDAQDRLAIARGKSKDHPGRGKGLRKPKPKPEPNGNANGPGNGKAKGNANGKSKDKPRRSGRPGYREPDVDDNDGADDDDSGDNRA